MSPAHLNRLRAAVLGANDGIVSVAAIIVGVAAAEPSARVVVLAGVAALVAGALSMAAGEYVSVSSQRDAERSTGAVELTSAWHAAAASLLAFLAGGALPLAAALLAPAGLRVSVTAVAVIATLALTGALAAGASSTGRARPVLRNVIGGGAAMGLTYAAGALLGTAL